VIPYRDSEPLGSRYQLQCSSAYWSFCDRIIVTAFCLDFGATSSRDCSLFRTLVHGSSLESEDQSILLPCSSAFTGCVSFKLSVLTYRSIHSTSTSYPQSCFTRVADMTSGRRLWSSASHCLEVPHVLLSTVGKRAFPVAGANMWNDLPFHITSTQSLVVFRQRLKTFLFSRSYPDILI